MFLVNKIKFPIFQKITLKKLFRTLNRMTVVKSNFGGDNYNKSSAVGTLPNALLDTLGT